MQHPAFASTLIIVGTVIVFLSAFADTLGLGRSPGFRRWQTLGAIVGALVILACVYLRRRVKPSP